MSFWLHGFCGKWEGWDPVNRFNHTCSVAIVTPTDRPKSVRNRCVIEVFGGVFVLSRCFFGFFCGCRGFWHRTESDLFLFLFIPGLTLTELRVVSMEHLQRVWLASKERLPFRTLVPSPFGDLLMLQLLRPVLPNLSYLFSTLNLEYPSVLSRFCFGLWISNNPRYFYFAWLRITKEGFILKRSYGLYCQFNRILK